MKDKWNLPLSHSPPRRRSEAYYDTLGRIGSDTPIIKDSWLYQWANKPPEQFWYHETVFQHCTPLMIVQRGWTVLEPAILELGDVFGTQKPESKNDALQQRAEIRAPVYEWLSLNRYQNRDCLLGVYGNEYVVAAAQSHRRRSQFIPCNFYRTLKNNGDWRNLNCSASYRLFMARFDTGYSFCTARQNLCCTVSYGLEAGVHGKSSLWAILNLDGVYIPAPDRLPLLSDLSDLPDKVAQINTSCRHFIQRTDAWLLREFGADQVYKLIRRLADTTVIPQYSLESLQSDSNLDKCNTRLDVLRTIMQSMHFKSDMHVPKFITLSQKFSNPHSLKRSKTYADH